MGRDVGLVMEGGALRGVFTCGVIDVFMENGITFDGAIGVSAGAAFGCNIKSKQIGRGIRYNKKYIRDKRYCSLGNLVRTGDIFGVEFCYNELPRKLDVFDEDTFRDNPMEFYVTATDAITGRPVHHRCSLGQDMDFRWIQASASIPMLSNVVDFMDTTACEAPASWKDFTEQPQSMHRQLLDGGISDSIPLRFFEHLGYKKNVVILTRYEGYVRGKNKAVPLAHLLLRKYPGMIKALADRHIMYNAETAYVKEQELAGKAFVIRPPREMNVPNFCKDPEMLEAGYQLGRKAALERLDELKAFLAEV